MGVCVFTALERKRKAIRSVCLTTRQESGCGALLLVELHGGGNSADCYQEL